MSTVLLNENPTIFTVGETNNESFFDILDRITCAHEHPAVNERDDIDAEEVFEHIRHLNDPEHPLTLEQLNVVTAAHVNVCDSESRCDIMFTPTIPHCSMATLIGLCIRVKLLRSLPTRFKVTIKIFPGSHASEYAVNKQLNDKERVAAALENQHLLKVINQCIAHTGPKK